MNTKVEYQWPVFQNIGWTCPKCGSCYSPTIPQCFKCPIPIVQQTTTIGTPAFGTGELHTDSGK
jgi:uncharacterized OB-fold protein